jgi:hypothetical protein
MIDGKKKKYQGHDGMWRWIKPLKWTEWYPEAKLARCSHVHEIQSMRRNK